MKSYAPYIWSAYAVSALMFLVLIVSSLAHARRWKKKAQARAGK